MEARELVQKLTLEEKLALTVGRNFWQLNAIERLNIPSITVNDGPHGLRKPENPEDIGLEGPIPATNFPSASAISTSWNTELVEEVGRAIGEEAQALGTQVVLGPGINIKRTPLGGRNFEYYSEDPVLAGELGTAFVRGVQSQGVGTSLKHYACNNQEFERMSISADVDTRTLREIYLAGFERVVKNAQPWTVMAAYNSINGTAATEHKELLTDILKEEWGFEGVVVSDWGAVNDKAKALEAGLDLEMPPGVGRDIQALAEKVRKGELSEKAVDKAAERVLKLILRAQENRKEGTTFDKDAHHALARKAAGESIVLLKNEEKILPLAAQSVAVIGRFARQPRFQGGGSSMMNPTRVDNAYDELQKALAGKAELSYADGYLDEGVGDEKLHQEALELAQKAEVAVIFAGLPDIYESEGYDRTHIDLPESHNRLIADICRVQPNTVVVLFNGSVVRMPWLADVKAVLEAGLGGQAGSGAVADVLTGKVNPSGKLTETFPQRIEDTPSYLSYPGEEGHVRYAEGLFVGYRYYDRKKMKPLFPFGYGLSYTTFEYSNLRVNRTETTEKDTVEVTVTIRNTGNVAGKEIVQLYVRDVESRLVRPEKELKAFAKVALEPGEAKDVTLTLQPRDFAYYDSTYHEWVIESGEFELLIGKSSADIVLRTTIQMNAHEPFRPLTITSYIKQIAKYPEALAVVKETLKGTFFADFLDSPFAGEMPFFKLIGFGMPREAVEGLLERINTVLSNR